MKVALLVDESGKLSSTDKAREVWVYECYGELRSKVGKRHWSSAEELVEFLHLARVECLLLFELDPALESLLEEYKIMAVVHRGSAIDEAFEDIFQIKKYDRRSPNIPGMARFQQSVQAYERQNVAFEIGYFDDDDIGGS